MTEFLFGNDSLSMCTDFISEILGFFKFCQFLGFLLIVLVSVVGNFVVIKTILTDREMRKVYCNIFIINLALCDIVQATVGMPPMASVLIFDKKWILSFDFLPDLPCQLAKSLNKIVPAVASYTNVVIAVDRLVGVLRPFRAKIPRSYALGLMGLTWMVCCGFGVFDFLKSFVISVPSQEGTCYHNFCYSDITTQQFNM